jgi:acetoin utilization deacetylase AcuC-like enzyme
MKYFFCPDALLNLSLLGIEIPLTDERIHKIVEHLKSKNILPADNFSEVELTRHDLENVHTKKFISQLFGNEDERNKAVSGTFELINSDGTFNRYNPSLATRPLYDVIDKVLLQVKGTMCATKEALLHGESYHLGGGYHHAMSFGGRGFCLLNDIVVAARWSQKALGTKLIWIIDVDAHKGDGTAELTFGDASIRTLSIHMKHGWPLDSKKVDATGTRFPWFIESDVDIGIEEGDEGQYLDRLIDGLEKLQKLDTAKPDLAIVVQGSDPYEKDQLPSSGLLRLSKEQMLKRDTMVHEFLKTRNIPMTYVMAGGYGEFAHEVYCQFIDYLHPEA